MSQNFTTRIDFGKTYTDEQTGFTGKATSVTFYATGCTRVCLTPPVDEKGQLRESQYFDESQLDKAAAAPGGPMPAPKRQENPR